MSARRIAFRFAEDYAWKLTLTGSVVPIDAEKVT
jgi:hypothetical protein